MIKKLKRKISFFLALTLMSGLMSVPAFARPEWPKDTGIQSESGIVMDMDSGAVLFAQSIHEQKAPASIVKLLTALVVVEQADLDEEVTFSHDAVYDVESGSGNKLQLEEGDVLSVRDCLYVLLLQSSNQCANALAEHVAGSREAFVELMNERAAKAGCRESHFANPSGLNDETQLTSAYDMALIASEAFKNPNILEISSTKKASIPATINNPNGRTFSMEHKLLVTEDPNDENYYPYAVAGKTGYTSIAGQTLVTYAIKEDRGLIAVTLKSTQKTHYSDTKEILEFGFSRFKNVSVAEHETAYVTGDEPFTVNGETYDVSELYLDETAMITLPNDAEFSDAEQYLQTELPADHPSNAVARIIYTYNDRQIGVCWILTTREPEPVLEETAADGSADPVSGQPEQKADVSSIFSGLPKEMVWGGAAVGAVVVLILLLVIAWKISRAKEEEQRRHRLEKRKKRLQEMGCSEEEFARMVEQRKRELEDRRG